MDLSYATSQEFSDVYDEKNHVVMFMPESSLNVMGGTMRLGSKTTFMYEYKFFKLKILYLWKNI